MTVLHDQRREPPGFGHGQPWKRRIIKFYERDGNESVLLTHAGMSVHPDLHEFYFTTRANAQKFLDDRARLGMNEVPIAVVALGDDRRPYLLLPLHATDGADEMAWLAAMLIEMDHHKTGFIIMTPEPSEEQLAAYIDNPARDAS